MPMQIIILLELEDGETIPDEDTTEVHSHKCGYPDGGGCGEVFQHTNLCAGSDAAHMCPACHRGPWRTIFFQRKEVSDGPTEG